MTPIHKRKIPKNIKTLTDAHLADSIIGEIAAYYRDHYFCFSNEWHDINLSILNKKRDQVKKILNSRRYRICA